MKIATSNGKIVEITHDGEISIATGRYRKETRWKNRDIHWSLFVEKVSKINYTSETMAEFLSAPKDRQDEIKDVGGFVGGSLAGGKRKAETIQARTLLTLDADTVEGSAEAFWDIYTLMYDNAAVVYSTHKHKPDKPRLRLVMPLNRPVTSIEYIAVSRYVAGELGINQFDDTTYEPERLMYWPSTAKDAEYYFEVQDGQWLDVDEVLATYHNWKDSTEWPVSDRQGDAIRREIKKQADPLEKTGIVGAFCRSYGIHKAIETFLSDIYDACDVDNRYTYKNGSTAAGLVVYDDKFAYSHHGTDPVSGILCNAFDLVRIHKFGNLDENVKKVGTRHDNYPSFVAMEKLARNDKPVKRLLMEERQKSAVSDFEGITDLQEEVDESWKDSLDCDKKGNVLPLRENIVHILKNDPAVGKISKDLFSDRKSFNGSLPVWRKGNDVDPFFRDDDESNLRRYLEYQYGLDSKGKVSDALDSVARINAFHPVKDYLESLIWDGEKRVETFFIDYLGVEDCKLFRESTKKALVACVARVMNTNVEFDYTTVLVGAQGTGKSKILAKLARNRRWFSDSIDIKGKEAYEGVRGKWIIEIAELAGFRKQDSETIKRFLTSPSDFYRAAFERYPQDQIRQCVFFGTTNDMSFLRDPTGARRFWPMEVNPSRKTKDQWTDLTPDIVDQVWAEAKQLYQSGLELHLPPELEKEMNIRQGTYTEEDDRKGIIKNYLDTLLPIDWEDKPIEKRREYLKNDDPIQAVGVIEREFVCVAEIWCECLEGRRSDLTRSISREIMNIMRNMEGWTYVSSPKTIKPYDRQKYFRRIERTSQPNFSCIDNGGCIF